MSKIYIAYGSNMNMEQMMWRCPSAKKLGTSVLKDYTLVFKGRSGNAHLSIEQHTGSITPVVLFSIEDSDEKSLDIYEGYPNYYIKKNLVVPFNDTDVEAMVYIMVDGCHFNIPSKVYYKICQKGYEDNNFELIPLIEAYQFAIKKVFERR